jgi:hypothetical protein
MKKTKNSTKQNFKLSLQRSDSIDVHNEIDQHFSNEIEN